MKKLMPQKVFSFFSGVRSKKPGSKGKSPVFFAVASLLLGAFMLTFLWYGFDRVTKKILTLNATETASRSLKFLERELDKFDHLFGKTELTEQDRFLFDSALSVGGVVQYKIIDPKGIIVSSSDPAELGSTYEKTEGHEPRGHTEILNLRKFQMHFHFEEEPKGTKRILGEVYTDFLRDGKFVGTIEFYMDFTEEYLQAKKISTIVFFGTALMLSALGGLIGLLVFLHDRGRKNSAEKLRESENRFRNLIEGSLQGVIVQRDQVPLFVNKAFAEIFAYSSPEEIYRLATVAPLIAPEDAQRLTRFRKSRMKGIDVPSHYLGQGIRKDGKKIWLDTIVTVVEWDGRPAVQAVVVDVSEAKMAEEKLRANEEKFRNIVEASLQGVVIHTQKPIFANRAAADIFGYESPGEILGLDDINLLFAPNEREGLVKLREARLRGEDRPDNYEVQGIRKDGTLIWVDAYVRVVNWEGQKAIQCNYIDITGRKKAENQLNTALRMEALGQLAGGVAHEFNNLLQIIMGNVHMILGEVHENLEIENSLKAIRTAAERGADLTGRFLSFGGKKLLKPELVDVNDVVTETVEMLRGPLGETVEIVVTLSDGPLVTLVDKGQLENVVVNLVINARDAMPEGGTVTILSKSVSLDGNSGETHPVAPSGDFVLLAVSDTGEGMSPEVQSRAFEPFFTTKGMADHSGLGLSIIYGFVQQSGGHVEIENQPNAGATVNIFLPAAPEI